MAGVCYDAMSAWGVIFDWDGVIVDSSAPHEESWHRLAREEGRVFPTDHFRRGFGMKNQTIIADLLEWTSDPQEIQRLALRKETLYREMIRDTGVPLLPGVARVLEDLRAASIPCAVGSSTPRLNIVCTVEQLGIDGVFPVIICAEDVTQGKPDPQVFLLAAQRLGIAPSRCVVVEDAPVGIQAARAARMRTVAVTTTHPADALRDADRVIRGMEELTAQGLGEWFGATSSYRT
ncbi:MAG: HAD family phosphatase [Candidatus Omnitrophica bacterium]|nr:HAD family phosphatase [Candidatus Omnitrophota bacterium]